MYVENGIVGKVHILTGKRKNKSSEQSEYLGKGPDFSKTYLPAETYMNMVITRRQENNYVSLIYLSCTGALLSSTIYLSVFS